MNNIRWFMCLNMLSISVLSRRWKKDKNKMNSSVDENKSRFARPWIRANISQPLLLLTFHCILGEFTFQHSLMANVAHKYRITYLFQMANVMPLHVIVWRENNTASCVANYLICLWKHIRIGRLQPMLWDLV